LHEASASLLPDTPRSGEGLREVLERIAARLGPQAVLRAVLAQDHRLEWMQQWQPATEQPPSKPGAAAGVPQPTWVLPEPLRLAERDHRPLYQGPLQLLAGPHRIEGGWWHRLDTAQGQSTGHVQRDYWVAASEHAGVLWIFQQRLGHEDTAWYLHGIFA
jgi:protein ImuB